MPCLCSCYPDIHTLTPHTPHPQQTPWDYDQTADQASSDSAHLIWRVNNRGQPGGMHPTAPHRAVSYELWIKSWSLGLRTLSARLASVKQPFPCDPDVC